jgi:hypothetical protein
MTKNSTLQTKSNSCWFKEWREFGQNWIMQVIQMSPTLSSAKEWSELLFSTVDFNEKLSLKRNAIGPLKRYFSHLCCKRLRKRECGMENTIKQILPSSYFSRPVPVLQSCHVWFSVHLTKLSSCQRFAVSDGEWIRADMEASGRVSLTREAHCASAKCLRQFCCLVTVWCIKRSARGATEVNNRIDA